MVGAVADLVDAGRVKLYCVDSLDAHSWSDRSIPIEERARRHATYAGWVRDVVVPWIFADCGGPVEIAVTGCSLGAYHALQAGLTRADLFPLVIGLSGNYDVVELVRLGRARRTRPTSRTRRTTCRSCTATTWTGCAAGCRWSSVSGQGAWETHPTGSLPSTRAHGSSVAGERNSL